MELALRTELAFSHVRRRAAFVTAATLAGALVLAPGSVSAEGLFDFLFGGTQKPQGRQAPAQANFFADPFGINQPAHPTSAPATRVAGSGPAFCVRSCDGKYFPLTMRGNASPVQTCQAFCPASVTKVFYGSNIDSAAAGNGERYADSENAYAYRKALRADCTCNGRSPSGLAPVDLTLDTSLRSGDVIATTDGLVAYTGVRLGTDQAAEFTPVACLSRPHGGCPRPAWRNEGGAGQRRDGRGQRAASRNTTRRRPADRLDTKNGCTEAAEAGRSELGDIAARWSGHKIAKTTPCKAEWTRSRVPHATDASAYRPTMTPITLGADRYFSSIAARAAARFSGVSKPRFSARIIQQ